MIGIFDSGYGGLTIMREILKILPQYDYMYLGDNARTPYGNHTKETITRYTEEAINYLFAKGCGLIIIACFTASGLALRELQEKYLRNSSSKFKNKKFLGVIRPIAEKAVLITKKNRIGVVGTRSTVASKAFETELKHQNPNVTVAQKACPLLVPLIEENWHEKQEARMILKKYLRPLKSHNIDTLILGCTHYSFMFKQFQRIMGKAVKVLNSGEIVSQSLQNYLKRHSEIENNLKKSGKRLFFTTDDIDRFKEFGKLFAKMPVMHIEKISL